MAQRILGLDIDVVVPLLKHNLEEEVNMEKWCSDKLPLVVEKMLPNVISINKN